ncbi:MAG: helix-turn-helix domain-containing protein [Pseudomonadota bacterium]
METADVVLRISTATLLLIFLGLAIRDGWQHKAIRFACLTAISMSALFLQLPEAPMSLRVPLRLTDACAIAFVWWTALALFEEDFTLKPVHWLGMIIYGINVYPYRFIDLGWMNSLPQWWGHMTDGVTFALIGHLIWKLVSGFQEDLVNRRRRFRVFFICMIIAALSISVIGENVLQAAGAGDRSIALTALVTLPIMVFLYFWALRLQPEVLLFQSVQIPEPRSPSIDPRDAAAHRRLLELMDQDRLWAEPGLTIGLLAGKLGVPEHQLRNLINNGIGHRNFASFLNGYRLDYAKSVLADAERARVPVLTIAMDAGFGSLAPFNRAFKAAEGVTPTAFRSRALADQS